MAGQFELLRKQIYLDRRLAGRLRESARRKRSTESALIREALSEYLAAEDGGIMRRVTIRSCR